MTAIACAAFTRDTPLAVIAIVALTSCAARSVGLTGLSTLSFADVPTAQMPSANAVSATGPAALLGLGVVAASVFVRLSRELVGSADPRSAYSAAFIATGVLAMLAGVILLRLRPAAGAGLARARARFGDDLADAIVNNPV